MSMAKVSSENNQINMCRFEDENLKGQTSPVMYEFSKALKLSQEQKTMCTSTVEDQYELLKENMQARSQIPFENKK